MLSSIFLNPGVTLFSLLQYCFLTLLDPCIHLTGSELEHQKSCQMLEDIDLSRGMWILAQRRLEGSQFWLK